MSAGMTGVDVGIPPLPWVRPLIAGISRIHGQHLPAGPARGISVRGVSGQSRFGKRGDGRREAAEAQRWQVGKVHRKVDAVDRMRGISRYTDDLKLPGMLHGKIKRSPHAHARIVRIDSTRA